jgi:hypothetical protein
MEALERESIARLMQQACNEALSKFKAKYEAGVEVFESNGGVERTQLVQQKEAERISFARERASQTRISNCAF